MICIDKFLKVNEGIVVEGIGKEEKKAGHIPVPLLIIEIKFKPSATDAIYRESFTMIEIKKIFPQCKSILLLFERKGTEETLRRNGFAFDEIICLGESNPQNASATGVDVSPENPKIKKLVKYIENALLFH